MEWISVNDRLPEPHKNITIKMWHELEIEDCWLSSSLKHFMHEPSGVITKLDDVTYWQLLPPKPIETTNK
jgi:hypothetical protein